MLSLSLYKNVGRNAMKNDKAGRLIPQLGLTIVLCVILLLLLPAETAKAATFDDLNQPSVFVKQQGSGTCTLASAVMMVRRAAMASGSSGWTSITEGSMRSTAWKNGVGLYHSFSYAGISVRHASLTGGSSNVGQLISLLSSHPEGIVIYDWNKPHAILLTDYTKGTFYCADPSNGNPSGRIPVSSSMITVEGADAYWYVSSPQVSLSGNSGNISGTTDDDASSGTAQNGTEGNDSASELKSTTLKKLQPGKKSIILTWKKLTAAKGYVIQYSTDKSFRKSKTKSVTIKTAKTTKTTIRKLKSNKKYYIRIRTYSTKGGKKVYSKWSKAKSVKVK